MHGCLVTPLECIHSDSDCREDSEGQKAVCREYETAINCSRDNDSYSKCTVANVSTDQLFMGFLFSVLPCNIIIFISII